MDLDLGGKHVLISGGSRGIGASVALAFAAEGCSVTITGRTRQSLDEAKRLIGDNCDAHVADATESAACFGVIERVRTDRGRLDVLVTCAGSGASVRPGAETAEEWHRVLGLNLQSATNMVEAALPLLEESAPASIVCISSICGHEAVGAPVTYSAAKAALIMAVKGWSRAFAKKLIRINAVSPGNIFFEGGAWDKKCQQDPGAVRAMLESEVPLGRFGEPAEIAAAVLFLASKRASFITGANLVADGGQTRGC
jgi:3-oxoacyl-[acyl-carrier protein] reductase